MKPPACALPNPKRAALTHKILVIEHDVQLQRLLRRTLTASDYRVIEASDHSSGISVAKAQRPSVIVLDRTHLKFSYLSIVSKLRRVIQSPIIILCENNDEGALALDAMAGDFMTKPFSKEELLARVRKAIVHSAPPLTHNAVFTLDSLRVDFLENRVFLDDREVNLTPTEFKVLSCLIQHCGRVLSPETILEVVWGSRNKHDKTTLRTIIHGLRRKIEDDPETPHYLTTEINVGYRLKEPQPSVRMA